MEQWWESYLDRIERGHVAIQVKVHVYYIGERLRSFFLSCDHRYISTRANKTLRSQGRLHSWNHGAV